MISKSRSVDSLIAKTKYSLLCQTKSSFTFAYYERTKHKLFYHAACLTFELLLSNGNYFTNLNFKIKPIKFTVYQFVRKLLSIHDMNSCTIRHCRKHIMQHCIMYCILHNFKTLLLK